jgi:hypothetical protein
MMGKVYKEAEKVVRRVRDDIKRSSKKFLGEKTYRLLGNIGLMIFDMMILVQSGGLFIEYIVFYWAKTGDIFAAFDAFVRHTIIGVADIFIMLGMDERRAYRISGYIFMAVIVIVCAVITYFSAGLASGIAAGIVAVVGAVTTGLVATLILTLVQVVIFTALSYMISKMTARMAVVIAGIHEVLGDIAVWLPICASLAMIVGSIASVLVPTNSVGTYFKAIEVSTTMGNIIAGLNTAYVCYGTYEAFMGYVEYKKMLEEAFNNAVADLKKVADSMRNAIFEEAMAFSSGRYYENHAGQTKYNMYQPARELYSSAVIANPFDGSGEDRLKDCMTELDMHLRANRFGAGQDSLSDGIDSSDIIKLGKQYNYRGIM